MLFDLRADAPTAPVAAPATAGAGPVGRFGREVARLQEWAESTASGDRDELVPGVSERAWRQVSVSARECLGGQRCPMAAECFSEQARERAHEVDVVVTNHALVAIDTFEGRRMLPEHDLLVLDEGHEFADRVTSVISDELSEGIVEAASKRVRQAGVKSTTRLDDAATALGGSLAEMPEGRLALGLPESLISVTSALRDAARDLLTELKNDPKDAADGGRQAARAALNELHDVTERLAGGQAGPQGPDVAWVARIRRPDGGSRTALHVAPLSVAGLLRQRLYDERTVVLTSATLALGGGFEAAAGSVGLLGEQAPPWRGLDVGSPFDYPRQGILYVARHLPAPGRDGVSPAALDELAALVEAAGGRTLGLFSSRRAAEYAAAELRERLDLPVLCQGEDSTPTLVREFARDAPDVPVRDPLALAGSRRSGIRLPAGRDRPDPVPAPGRPAGVGPAAGRRPCGRERLHERGRDACRPAARAGRRPAGPHGGGPRRGRRPRLPARDRAVRRVPAGVPAVLLDDREPGGRARRAAPHRRRGHPAAACPGLGGAGGGSYRLSVLSSGRSSEQGRPALAASFPRVPGYLNAATLGLPLQATTAALRRAVDDWERGVLDMPGADAAVVRAREAYARIAGVPAAWVAAAPQVSVLVGLVAAALPDGAEVVVPEGDFASVVFPFMVHADRGVSVRHVPLERLAESIGSRTSLVAFSLVQSADGRLADTAAVRRGRERGGTP